MSYCYDTYLLNKHEEREDMADELEEAIEAERKRIHAELMDEFRNGLAGTVTELRSVCPTCCPDEELATEETTTVHEALCDALGNGSVWKLFMLALGKPSPSITAAFMTEAATHYADTYADDLAELEIERRRAGK